MTDDTILEQLFTEPVIQGRVTELAAQISEDYESCEELLMVGILKGAFIFLADLSRKLTIPRRVDFIAISSYGDSSVSSGAVRLIMDVRANIENKHVLIVDDILDTGKTMNYLLEMFQPRRPASMKTCVLLRKNKHRKPDPPIDYLGFEIEDIWVVGYGLDYADQYRTLPHISVLSQLT